MQLKEKINPSTIYNAASSGSMLCVSASIQSSISQFERGENNKVRNGRGNYLGTAGKVQ